MVPPEWTNKVAIGCLGPNHPDDSIADVCLRKVHNPRKRKVHGKAGFLVDSDDDEPPQKRLRKILSLLPPASTLEKRRRKARNPFLLSPSTPPDTQGSTGHAVENGEEALDIPFPQGPDGSDPNSSLLPDPNLEQATEENHKTTLEQTQSREGSFDIAQAATLGGALVVKQPSDACATKQTLEEGAAEKKHVSFAEEAVVLTPIAPEDPRSPSEESLASLFGDDDTDFDNELGLGSCASPGVTTGEGPGKTDDSTPEPDYPQIAVEWKTPEFDYFNPYPAWVDEPSTDAVVATLKAAHDPRLHYTVELLWEGQYNRFYDVRFDGAAYVLKATLPVCPGLKTASEVATLRWTWEETCLPVPTVAAAANGDDGLYSTSAANPLGCEWILFDRVPGRPLSACWRSTEFGVKQRIVVQLAAYTAAVWDRRFDNIGNLYPRPPIVGFSALNTKPQPGAMVSPHLFWNGRSERFRPATGPFATYREWAFERLELVAREAFARLRQIVSQRLRAVPWRISFVVARLRVLHDRLFPPRQGQESPEEPTMLWHDNLSADNLLVDDDGVLTGVLEWDNVSCTPRSLCDLPALLQDSPDRAEPPNHCHWDFTADGVPVPRDSYWPRLREYEITELRALFLAEMSCRSLEWTMTYRYNGLRRDFEAAVQNCDHPLFLPVVEKWLDAIDEGLAADEHPQNLKVWSLQERCVQGARNKD